MRAVGLEVEVGRTLERLRQHADAGDVVDGEHAHVTAPVIVGDQVDAAPETMKPYGSTRRGAARRSCRCSRTARADDRARPFAASRRSARPRGSSATDSRRIASDETASPWSRAGRSTAAAWRSSPRCRLAERAAERSAEAFEGHQAEQLALVEVEPAQAVAFGESVRPALAVEVPREARVGQHGEITPQAARARRLVVGDCSLSSSNVKRPSSIALSRRTSRTTFGSDRSSAVTGRRSVYPPARVSATCVRLGSRTRSPLVRGESDRVEIEARDGSWSQ